MRSEKAIINIISSLILQVIAIICGLIVPRTIIGTFGSETNGLITSITQFLGYITLLEAGIGPVIKAALYKPIAQKDKKTIEKVLKSSEAFFRKISYIFIIYVILLCVIFPIIMNGQFNMIYTVSLVLIISISTFAEYFFGMVYKLYLQAEQKTYIVSIIQMIGYILNTVCVVILIKLKCNIQIVKLVSASIFILRPLLQNWYVKNKYKICLKNIENNYELKQKWDGLSQHIASVIHSNTDIIILTILATVKDVSVYSVYSLVVNGIRQIIQSFANGIDATFGDMIARDETEHLQKSFKLYELFYYTIITIVFTCTLLLIIPFVKVYTKGITDYNYILPEFAYIIVIAELVWAIRQPYNALIKGKGHFKETRVGAWIEASTNIIISVALVVKYGMLGVAIGTLIAMLIRTIEFIIYSSKYILNRNIWYGLKCILIVLIEIIFVILLNHMIFSEYVVLSYLYLVIYAMIIGSISTVIVLVLNYIFYNKQFKEILKIIKNKIKRKDANNV